MLLIYISRACSRCIDKIQSLLFLIIGSSFDRVVPLPNIVQMTSEKATETMNAMKAMTTTKATKRMSARRAIRRTFRGKQRKTNGGVTKDGLVKNKRGKIVFKAKSDLGKFNSWIISVSIAKWALGVTGFITVPKGSALYNKAKSIHATGRCTTRPE